MKIAVAALLFFVSAIAQAQTIVPVSVQTYKLYVTVSPATVKLSRAGYSQELVKILIPGIADFALLNHRNEGEEAPCLATWEIQDPQQIHEGRDEVDVVDVVFKLSKVYHKNTRTNVCHVILFEDIEAEIRGVPFNHHREQQLADRHIDDCR